MKNGIKNSVKIIHGLVDVTQIDPTLIIDLKYAKSDNFLKTKLYPVEKCVLQQKVAVSLAESNKEFHKLGYCLKVWDAYRPLSVQKMMWKVMPNDDFIADPSHGSVHNRGAAVDVTLTDKNGNDIEMPSSFDDFTEKAYINFTGATKEAIKHREFLAEIMVKHGFTRLDSEWWHFYGPGAYDYPIMDIKLEDFC